MRRRTHSGGFTLIELLVVIAIIGVLASVVLATMAPAREKARDARRLSDMKQIQNALELYYATNREFPRLRDCTSSSICATNWSALGAALAPYINPMPRDPINDTTYVYYYDSNSGDSYQTYGLMMKFESSLNAQKMVDDGGYQTLFYELGVQPKYCMGKYGPDTNGRWWPATASAHVCITGS